MDILLVERNPADAECSAGLFRSLGHRVVVAASGLGALTYYEQHQPDVVVTGIEVPGLDGFALTEAIQRCAAPDWQPVFFLSDRWDETLQLRAQELGADAFFVKPLSRSAVSARLGVVACLLKTQKAAEVRQVRIDRYLAAEQNDLQIARHLIEHQMAPDGQYRSDQARCGDPAVEYWRQTCSSLGGDMLCVRRAPSGVLHVMLADASGHGLAAYVSLLPIVAPFHRMTEKGFPLATIARELNEKIRQALPPERTVAALLVAVDAREGIVTLWNGGMPAAFMLNGAGSMAREFLLIHPSLGTEAEGVFDDRVEQHPLVPGEHLVMVSDGLLAAQGADGQGFGRGRLASVLAACGSPVQQSAQRCAGVAAALEAHLDGRSADDDMSLVLVDCERGGDVPDAVQAPSRERRSGNWRFSLRLGASELGHFDVVPLLLNVAEQFGVAQSRVGELFVILSELFNNALDHGVLGLDSRLKLSPDGMEQWLTARADRLSSLETGEVDISIEQLVESDQAWLRICCRDSGAGFDVQGTLGGQAEEVLQETDSPSVLPYGRGLALMRRLAQRVDFNEAGNEVRVMLVFT